MFELLGGIGFEAGVAVGVGHLLTAGALGVTHGIEPDHVAGITALTHEAGDPKLSALVGGCFATGHALLVVCWIVLAYLAFGTTSFPAVYERVGLLFVGIILALLSFYLGITATRNLIHRHEHDHGEGPHTHHHVHWPASLQRSTSSQHGDNADASHDGHATHEHDHSTLGYLKIGTVGALFTLSPPVSMIAFISVALSESGTPLLFGGVATYAVSIIATMALIGGSAGSLFEASKAKGQRVHAMSQVVAAVLVLGFALDTLVDIVPTFLA